MDSQKKAGPTGDSKRTKPSSDMGISGGRGLEWEVSLDSIQVAKAEQRSLAEPQSADGV